MFAENARSVLDNTLPITKHIPGNRLCSLRMGRMTTRRIRSRQLDYVRYHQWVGASHALDRILPNLVPVIQGIGKIDAELCAEDADYFARGEIAAQRSPAEFNRFAERESESFTDRINLSALWLFGAYEVVRTIDQAFGKQALGSPTRLAARIKAVKKEIERPRVLLAKLEPARRHEATDLAPADPWVEGESIAWRVAPRTIVSRRSLADSMLALLKEIGAWAKRRK